MNFKKWIPGVMLGAMMAAMVTVPVMADNINSGSTPPIEFSRVSSTSADSNSGDDSGKVYDFKDPKTSGVVTVTKNWDDSSSNDERTIPDVSISTVEPSKLNRTYTITFHGNGLKFTDGSEENTVVYNGSGQIISGAYNIPIGAFVEWCFDTAFKHKAIFNNDGTLTSSFLNSIDRTSIDLYAKEKTFVLKGSSGYRNAFNDLIPDTAASVVFTDETMPSSAELIDVDADGDGGTVAWMDGTTMKVSTQTSGQKVIASTNCEKMFYNKSKLISIDFTNLNTAKVTNMRYMFYNCNRLISLDLSPLDTSKVTNMYSMFGDCSKLIELNLSNFNTSQVTDMSWIFSDCKSITSLNLSSFDTKNVTKMSYMFNHCEKITSINVSKSINTKNVVTMNSMFESCKSLKKIDFLNLLDTSNVKYMNSMFSGCINLISISLTTWDTSNVTTMSYMFSGCSSLKSIDLTPLNTSNVTDMSCMFLSCKGLTSIDPSPLDTSNVTDMSGMFRNCTNLTSLDLSLLNVSHCELLTDSELNSNGGISSRKGGMFSGCSNLSNLILPNFTSLVTKTTCLFMDCESLTDLDLSPLDTSNVTDMSYMFNGCDFTSIDLSTLNTSSVTHMNKMFSWCKNLIRLDLSNFDTKNLISMNDMFGASNNLNSITLGANFAFIGSDYYLPTGTWYSSDGTPYESSLNGNIYSCNIPSNKADTYTRR